MGVFRLVVRFTNLLNRRSWSEIFHKTIASASAANQVTRAQLQVLVQQRCQCLVNRNRLMDIRINEVSTPKVTSLMNFNVAGNLGNGGAGDGLQDVVNVARLIRLTSAGVARANYLQRGIADNDVVNGEFTFGGNGQAPYDNWLTHLRTASFHLRQANFTAALAFTNVTNGSITLGIGTLADIPAGTILSLRGQVLGNGPKINAYASVAVDVAAGSFAIPLARWRQGNLGPGNYRQVTYTYPDLTGASPVGIDARVRKTGGPLGKFRGARSKR